MFSAGVLLLPPDQKRSFAPQSRIQDRWQVSRGTFDRLRRATAGFTFSALDGLGLCCHWPARPNTACLTSSSCSSTRVFAPRFFQAPPRGGCYFTLALRYHFTSIW